MSIILRALLIILLAASYNPVQAASFNCARASSDSERAICANAELGKLDEELAQTYRALLKSAGKSSVIELKTEQADWLSARNRCGADVQCLATSYQSRLAVLRNYKPKDDSPKAVFKNLSKFNDEKNYPYYELLFQDKEIQDALNAVLLADYGKFADTMQAIEISEPLVAKDGVLRVYGWVPHAHTIAEAAFIVEPFGNVYVAILEKGERLLYYTNDRNRTTQMPEEFKKWSKRFDAKVVYMSR